MVAVAKTGNHFTDLWLMQPSTCLAANMAFFDSSPTSRISSIVAFFTGLASYGVIDSTNWTANTFKTIYSHTGSGLIFALVGPTAGGAETTTFEVTIDSGAAQLLTVTNANAERALLTAHGIAEGAGNADFTTAGKWVSPADAGLDAGTLTTLQTGVFVIPSMRFTMALGVPLLRYNTSCLIRMKHSTSITNSTATAYSGVMVRKGIVA